MTPEDLRLRSRVKDELRRRMRAIRKATAAALPDAVRSLVFSRPPAPVIERIADGAVIGLYRESGHEAPATRYAQYFLENGHRIALPRCGALPRRVRG